MLSYVTVMPGCAQRNIRDITMVLVARARIYYGHAWTGLPRWRGIDSTDTSTTTPETASVAMKAFKQPKVLIVGGYDRGIDMTPLVGEITKQRIRHVITMGQTGRHIAEAFSSQVD